MRQAFKIVGPHLWPRFALVRLRPLLLGCAACTLSASLATGEEASGAFPDPSGDHRAVTLRARGNSGAPQAAEQPAPARPWVQQPSPRIAARLQGWRVSFVPDKAVPDPAKGVFASLSYASNDSTVRLLKRGASAPIKLAPVAWRTRYVPRTESRTDPKDRVITPDLVAVLAGPEIARFIASERLGSPRLDVAQHLAVALVQEFDAALRAPRRREHIWSIYWRVETNPGANDYIGYEAWGLFTRVSGALKPFHLAARESSASGETSDYFYVLGTGDLDSDGIDEMVVREMVFEAEDDYVQLWAWEHGMPVTISKIP